MPSQTFAFVNVFEKTGSNASGEKVTISPTCFIPLLNRTFPTELNKTIEGSRRYVRFRVFCSELMHWPPFSERTSSARTEPAGIRPLPCKGACARAHPTKNRGQCATRRAAESNRNHKSDSRPPSFLRVASRGI